ncbi:MAG: formylglycine-generating enzyme family protein [Leptospirales bacterium]|nr:formylglycine-generating enzyme family protein [Leptospirales bacterium]
MKTKAKSSITPIIAAIILGMAFIACGDDSSSGGGGVAIDMVKINGGTFVMGSPVGEPDRSTNETEHSVTVSGFYMSKYQVTQGLYEDVMGYNPSYFKDSNLPSVLTSGDNLPVESVTWYDALEFCNKLSAREGLDEVYAITVITRHDDGNITDATVDVDWSKNGYRLPTEAEWEYACRSGKTTAFNWGTDTISSDQANFYAISNLYNGSLAGEYRATTTEVGIFSPNAWGLYDMHGNVWEWCWDWYGTYPSEPETDPTGPDSGVYRVIRGGSWCDNGRFLRSAFRHYVPDLRGSNLGFRVARL